MRVRSVVQGILLASAVLMGACGPAPSSDWVLLSEDSEGKPTFINSESIRWRGEGLAVYRRVVGDPSAEDRVEFLQALDCVNLRWAFLTLDEGLLDSILGDSLQPEEWELLALTPANRVLLDTVCEAFPPARWIRVLNEGSEELGGLKDVWVDRETLDGPSRDSVWTEMEDLGYSDDVIRSWSRWNEVSPDSGYFMIQADVACDKSLLRYLENSRYTREGELDGEAANVDFWFLMSELSFEEQVYGAVCRMAKFFQPGAGRP